MRSFCVMSLGYYICVGNKIMEQVTLWASITKARALQLSWSAPICYNLDYQLMWGGNEVAAGGEILISSFIKQIWPDKLSAVLNCSVIDRVMLFSSSIVFRPSFCFLIDCFNVQITFYCITMGNSKLNFISHGDESRIVKIPKPGIIVSAWYNSTIIDLLTYNLQSPPCLSSHYNSNLRVNILCHVDFIFIRVIS